VLAYKQAKTLSREMRGRVLWHNKRQNMKPKHIINLGIGVTAFVLILFVSDTQNQILLATASIINFGCIPNDKEV